MNATTPPPSDPAAELRLLLLAAAYTEDGAYEPRNIAEILLAVGEQITNAIDRLTVAITETKEPATGV